MTVALVGGTLVAVVFGAPYLVVGQLRLDAITDLDDGEVIGALEHGTGDQIADALLEFFIDGLATGLADNGADDALGVLGSDAADVGGSDVALDVFGILAGFVVGLALADQLVHVDLAAVAVDGDTCVPLKVQDTLVATGKGCLETLDQIELVDLAFVSQSLKGVDELGACHVVRFLSLCVEVNRALDLGTLDIVQIKRDGGSVFGFHQHASVFESAEGAPPAGTPFLGLYAGDVHLLAREAREMRGGAQGPVDTRRAHFQRVGSREGIERVHDVVDPCLRRRKLVEADAFGRVYIHADGRRLLGPHHFHRDDFHVAVGRILFQGVKQALFFGCKHASP